MDSTDTLVELFNSANSGGSDYGASYHQTWIECGRKGQLKEADKAARLLPVVDGDETVEEVGAPADKINSLFVGIYAHKLWEGRIKRQLGEDLVWDSRAHVFNPSFLKAIEVYKNYISHWNWLTDRFGCEIVGTEVSLGSGRVADLVQNVLGGPYTGRADCIINIIDPDLCEHNTGLRLLPGRYIYDLKTGKTHGSNDAALYQDGIQGLGYLWLDTLERGEEGALGMVFDRVIWGHKVTTIEKSYAAYVAYPRLESEEVLRAMVGASNYNRANPLPNPFACKDKFGGTCWYKLAGKCSGF